VLIRRRSRTLDLSSELDWLFGPLDGYSEELLREAWERHREKLMAEAGRAGPGRRPLAWWRFVAGCPERLDNRSLDADELEPVVWLARNRHLQSWEVEQIRAEGREAATRIGTDHERMESPAISRDRTALRLARAVEATLEGALDDGPDWGVAREQPGGWSA
jgi:hypothetical protein